MPPANDYETSGGVTSPAGNTHVPVLTLADVGRETEGLANKLAADLAQPTPALARLLHGWEGLRAAMTQPVAMTPALFWQDGQEIVWPRTLTLIQGKYGAHKSRVAELFGAAVLCPGGQLEGDALGLEFRPVAGTDYRLLYLDTERNTAEHFPFALQRMKTRAGFELADVPANLFATSLLLESRENRFAAVREFLAHHRAEFTGHLIVVLDVLTDCVTDFNDVAASLQLIDLLNAAISEQNATFIAVIHENPGNSTGEKARGTLGTEAGNKASTVLQVGFVREGGRATELIQLRYLKRRYGPPEFTVFAVYDEETRGLVRAPEELAATAGTATATGQSRPPKLAGVVALLPDLLREPRPAEELETLLAGRLSKTARTVRDYLAQLTPAGAAGIVNAAGQLSQLTKEAHPTDKRKQLYLLRPLTPLPESGK